MKKKLIAIIIFLFSSFQMKAQIPDSLIQLYPGMGDTIDFIDREMFGFFENIKEFKSAQLFISNHKSLVSKIIFFKNGIEKRLTLIKNISALSEIKHRLSELEEENIDKIRNPPKVSVQVSDENIITGRLKMFSKKYLFLDSMTYNTNYESQLLHCKIPTAQVNYLHLTQERGAEKYLEYIGYGALGGGVLGFLIGYTLDEYGHLTGFEKLDNSERAAMDGLIGLGVGALVGLIIGEIAAPFYNDFTITFNSPNDVLKLREYSAYYYQPDKVIEEKYVEIE